MARSVPLTMESAPLEPGFSFLSLSFPVSALCSPSLLLAQCHLLQEASQTTLARSVYKSLPTPYLALTPSCSSPLVTTVFACLAFL